MTRDEYVEICSHCRNRKFDTQQGVICGLTNEIAAFENQCNHYRLDEPSNMDQTAYERLPMQEDAGRISVDVIKQLRSHQDLGFAIIGGTAGALAGALLWAAFTVATNYQIGYMAVAVGLLVGFTVRYFGSGIDQYYGIVGAFFALAGCALGNLLSQVVFLADYQAIGYYEVLTYLNIEMVRGIFTETFAPMDVLFYAIAAYEGFKFSFRRLSSDEIHNASEGKASAPAFHRFRLPIVAALFIGISALVFVLRQGYSGEK